MTTPTYQHLPLTTASPPPKPPLFRVELQWLAPPLDPIGMHLMQRLLDAFEPAATPQLRATNDDFTATFGTPWTAPMEVPRRVEVLKQLLQCLGVLRPFRSRWEVYGPEDTTDDVAERLHQNPTWNYYGPTAPPRSAE